MALRRRFRFIWRYFTGDLPWDSGIVPPEVVAWVERSDNGPGRALDLGCGPGTTSIYLAQQGWDTVGVDFAPNAISLARRRARREAGRESFAGSLTFLSADVARPDVLRDADPFDLVVDVGCLHGLPLDRRAGYATNLQRWTRPGATYLLYAFLPFVSESGRGVGIDQDGLRDLLGPGFELVSYTVGEEVTTPRRSAWALLHRIDREPGGAQ